MHRDHCLFVALLPEESRLVLRLRDSLYDGSWERMRIELCARLARLDPAQDFSAKLEGDLVRLSRLEAYEKRYGVNLANFSRLMMTSAG